MNRARQYQMGLVVICLGIASVARAQAILYVDAQAPPDGDGQSWAGAYQDLTIAIVNAGSTTSEIHVAQGTYRPWYRTNSIDPRSATFQLRNHLSVQGGYAGES